MSNIRNQIVTTVDSEKITVDSQDQQTVADITSQQLLVKILQALEKINSLWGTVLINYNY